MEYNDKKNVISLKGQTSNKYATMMGNNMKFYSESKQAQTEFYLFKYQSTTNNTQELVYNIINMGEPIPLIIKYKVGNKFIPLGISSSGSIVSMSGFLFKVNKMGSDTKLQPGPYNSISIWRPIPPKGYVSLGDIAVSNIGGKVAPPQVFKLDKNQSIYQVNNNLGPPVVCVPHSCVKQLVNNENAWDNTKGGYCNIFNSSDSYKNKKPVKKRQLKPCYLWINGITDALSENRNRPYQNFINDGGYNLFRCSTTNAPPSGLNLASYKLKEDCIRICIPTEGSRCGPKVGFNYPGELTLFGNRPTYMKDTGYFPEYEHAYIESNTPLEYNNTKKSYYIEYVKDANPNKEQIESMPKDTHVKGNPLYYINVENKVENNFTNCLMMNCDKEDNCKLESTKCNYNDNRMLWRVKGGVGSDDASDFNPNNPDSESQNINLMSHENNKCIRQYYNSDGVNKIDVDDCDWDHEPNWKYKSLNITNL